MRKKQLLLFFILQITLAFSQEKIIFHDINWKVVNNEKKAFYYRPMPLLKTQNLQLLRDFYVKEKTLQMQGYYADSIEKNYVGEVFWYRSNGEDYYSSIYINKSKQKKLSYYFDNGKLWKTVEYGDSLKHGKTIEYKPDGSILGESLYKNGYLISGTAGHLENSIDYKRYHKKSKYDQSVYIPEYKGAERDYTSIKYWKTTLKTAVEYTYYNGKIVVEKNFDENGNLLQKLDTTSYFKNTKELKNGRQYYYKNYKSAILEAPTFIEYRSYPFSDVKLDYISHLVLYRGTIQFLEKHPEKNLYRKTAYAFFKDNETLWMRLELNFQFEDAWKPLGDFLDQETQLISVTDIESYSKEKIFDKFSKKTWYNKDLKNKTISETLYFASPDFMGKTVKSSTQKTTNEKESALIYLNIAPEKYILLRENGGYFIPKKSGDIIEIPNFVLN